MELNNIFEKYFNPCSYEPLKEDKEMCKECGGCCCKSMGCHISPFDLKEVSVESIISLITESNCVSIDWWEGNPNTGNHDDTRTYFLRIKNNNSKVIDPSFGGVCSILTDKGCPLPFEYRPKGARDLVPAYIDCEAYYSKQCCAIDWYNYQNVMKAVYSYFEAQKDMSEFCLLTSIFNDLLNTVSEKE